MVATYEQLASFLEQLGDDIPRPWLNNYSESINKSLTIDSESSLVDLLESACAEHKDATAYSFMGEKITYADLDMRTKQFAIYLLKHLNIKPGARVGIMLPNSFHFPVAFFGILRAGMTVVTINPLYTDHELTVQLKDAKCSALLVLESCAHVAAKSLTSVPIDHIIIARIGDFFGFFKRKLIHFIVKYQRRLIQPYDLPNAHYFKKILRYQTDLATVALKKPTAQQIALIQYTGGTSGTPKGVMLSHGNLTANSQQCRFMLQDMLHQGPYTVLGALPFYHIYSLMICSICFISLGAECVLVVDPRQKNDLINTLKNNDINVFVGINTLFQSLLQNKKFAAVDCSKWLLTITGGMAIQDTVYKQWRQRTETNIVQGYGLSEASPVVSVNLSQDASLSSSIGMPIPGTDICLLRMDEIGLSAVGEPGELCVRGPQVMQGYWQQIEKTQISIINSWLLTGDIAKMDANGNLFLVDRKKDMVIVSGFNVYPAEVEEVLLSCPGVDDAAVIGRDDPETGEALYAYIVKGDLNISANDIIAYSHHRLAGYKIPKKITFIDDMPRSPIGKLLRRKLQDR